MIVYICDDYAKRLLDLLGTSPMDVSIKAQLDPHGKFHEVRRYISDQERTRIIAELISYDGSIDDGPEYIVDSLQKGVAGYNSYTDAHLLSEISENYADDRDSLPESLKSIKAIQDKFLDIDQAHAERAAERRQEGG